jgi:hypothetical protein
MRRSRSAIGAWIGSIAVLLVPASAASAASVPLHDGGGSRTVAGKRALFALPDGWTRYRTVSSNARTSDTYVHAARISADRTCRFLLSTRAQLQRRHPTTPSRVSERGRRGSLHWYLDAADRGYAAVAYRAAPESLASERRRYAAYRMTLIAEDSGCDGEVVKQRGVLRSAIRSARLTAGRAR